MILWKDRSSYIPWRVTAWGGKSSNKDFLERHASGES